VSLRVRLILATASAVAVAVLLCAVGAYVIVRHELTHQVDVALARRLDLRGRVDIGPPLAADAPPRRLPGGEVATLQVVSAAGATAGNGTPLPVTPADEQMAAAGVTAIHFRDAHVGGAHLRIASRGVGEGFALQVAQDLGAVDGTLHRLVLLLALLALVGVAVAAFLGMTVARAALAPVERLTTAAERVAETRDLTATIEVRGVDELARLASTLNAMLVALDESQRSQRRLIADASHELRTPLTSLRTNLEVLARSHDLPEPDRQALLGDLIAQVAELGALVGQLVDLDRTDSTAAETTEPVMFDEVVATAVSRARRNAPSLRFEVELEPTPVRGLAGLLGRAAANLVDNAAKWSRPGGTIEVTLTGGVLRVRDHGPGIDPGDIPHVFDRFYRSAAARGLPGSGLGLSIVKQAAEDHHGRAWVEAAPGGGTVACLALPVLQPPTLQPSPLQPPAFQPAAPEQGNDAGDGAALPGRGVGAGEGEPSVSTPLPASSDL
jgi:two-component system sensor histidine kinase MprB